MSDHLCSPEDPNQVPYLIRLLPGEQSKDSRGLPQVIWCNIEVFKVAGCIDDGRQILGATLPGCPLVYEDGETQFYSTDLTKVKPYLTGFLKGDGCYQMRLADPLLHFDEDEEIDAFTKMLRQARDFVAQHVDHWAEY
jgi:hypothetical protein